MMRAKISQKDRRHSGRVTPRLVKGYPMKEAMEDAVEPQEQWDDWTDYRDSQRNFTDKFQKYRWRKSKKVKNEIIIRKEKLISK